MDPSARVPAVLALFEQSVKQSGARTQPAIAELRQRFAPEAFAAASVAASEDQAPLLEALITAELVSCHQTDGLGRSLLHLAARRGATRAVAALLAQPDPAVNLRATRADGATALHHAAAAGHEQIASLLLQADADPDVMSIEDGYSCLHYAALTGSSGLVEELTKARATVDAVSLTGATPLHVAALAGHLECARALLRAGADLTKECCETDDQGKLMDPAGIAAAGGHHELVSFLRTQAQPRGQAAAVIDGTREITAPGDKALTLTGLLQKEYKISAADAENLAASALTDIWEGFAKLKTAPSSVSAHRLLGVLKTFLLKEPATYAGQIESLLSKYDEQESLAQDDQTLFDGLVDSIETSLLVACPRSNKTA